MEKGYYYIRYYFDGEDLLFGCASYERIPDYKTALAKAKEDHKQEIEHQRYECGAMFGDEIANTAVIYFDPTDGNHYEVATIVGWKSRVKEWVYE